MSLQPILKTLSFEFSVQIHSELTMTPINALQYIMGTSVHASSFFFRTLLQYLQNTFFSLLLLFTSCFGTGSWTSLWSNKVVTKNVQQKIF